MSRIYMAEEIADKKYYTAKELAEKLGASESTIRRWGKENVIGTFQPYGKNGKVMYFIKVDYGTV